VPPGRPAGELRPRQAGCRRGVCAPAQDAAELARTRGPRVARARGVGARGDRARRGNTRGGARAAGVRRAHRRAAMRAPAPAKLNLALVVGPLRQDGKHEVVTVYQRLGIADRIDVELADRISVVGFPGDRLVRPALERLAAHAAPPRRWRARIEKHVPVAAGLGGGSSDAATALRLANTTLEEPVPPDELRELAAELGADVPFFLEDGPQAGSGGGSLLVPTNMTQVFWVLLVLQYDLAMATTGTVYFAFVP